MIADRRIDLSARQYLMFIILASFCKSTSLTALLFFSPPASSRLLTVRFGQLLSGQTLFLSQHIGSKVSFISSDSSCSVSSIQGGSAVRSDAQRWLVPLKNFRLLFLVYNRGFTIRKTRFADLRLPAETGVD